MADTSVKAYKKRNGFISLHLNSHLMAFAKEKAGYSLTHYLKDIKCYLTLEDKTKIELDEISISGACDYAFDTMVHSFKASTITNLTDIPDKIGLLELFYHISFTGHPAEEPDNFEIVVPIIRRY